MKKNYLKFKTDFLKKIVIVGVFLFALFSFQQSYGANPTNKLIAAINCGGPAYTAVDGTQFTADQYNVSGGTWTQGNADDIVGTEDDVLFKTERNGSFGYAIPVPATGEYKVILMFAEVYHDEAGKRLFNVSIEGNEVLTNFDCVAEAGKNVAIKKEFELEITDGVINIDGATVKDGGKISAIIVEAIDLTYGIAINCGGDAFTAADGTIFKKDTLKVSGGQFGMWGDPEIADTEDDVVYRSETNGNYSYEIPVPFAGDYKITLLFAEVWHSEAGKRVFNVSIEGNEVLTNFDIVAAVGKNVALKKEFEFEITDGVINIVGTTITDGAKISAIIVESAKAPDNAPPVTLIDSWTAGTTKAKAAGTKRLLVVAVTGEISVMDNLTDIGLTYGGQVMTKVVSESIGTTGFGNFSYIFTLNEAGIAAADETGTLVPTWTTTAPAGFDLYSAFYDNIDQTTPVGAISEFNMNGTLITAPAVAAGSGDMVLMSVAFAGQPRTPTYTTGFIEILKNPNAQSWGSGIIAYKDGDGTEVIPSITNSSGERAALTAIVLKKGKNLVKTPVVQLDSWTAGTTKAKAAGTKRLLVATVTGEISVMDNLTDISLTYGGQVMNKIVSTSEGTTGFGNFSYIFTLNEAGIAAADETGTFVPSWTTTAPAGFDIFSSFFDKVDQTTPVSDTSFFHINAALVTAPAVNAANGDMVLMSIAFAGQPRTPSYTTGFIEVLKNPNAQSWGSGIIAYKEGDGTEVIPSITNSSGERAALTAIVLKGGEEEGVAPTYYKLAANSTTGGTVKIDPMRAKYVDGTVVKFQAVPDFGYYFVNWTDDLNGIVSDTASIVMNSNKTVTANFAEKTKYTITTSVSNGSIFLSPAGGTYYEGVEVTVLAKEYVGYTFNGWGGDLSGTENPQKIVVNSNKTISANIEKIPAYTLAISATNGSVKANPNKETYEPGAAVILVATPAEGYRFKTWEGDLTSTQNPTSVVMNTDKILTAVFELIPPSYSLTIEGSNGIVTLDPEGGIYEKGTVVTITATPDDKFMFSNWSGDLSGSVNPTTITVDGNKNVTAVFDLKTGVNTIYINGSENAMLEQNYPNPFSSVTTIPYQINKDSHVRLTVYNFLGEKVTTLVDQNQTAGQYNVDWDVNKEKSLVNGIYIYRLEIDHSLIQAKKAVITK